MKTVTAYKCEFCHHGRPYASQSACAAHEDRCFHNPATRSCATCKHADIVVVPVDGRPGYVTTETHCKARKPGEPLTTLCPSWKPQEDR